VENLFSLFLIFKLFDMNILIINHLEKYCGVYQYGKRVSDILIQSKTHNFIYLELESHQQLNGEIEKYSPDFIIYNWTGGTMPWVTPETVQTLRESGILQFLLVHNTWNYSLFFDGYFHQHPYWKNVDNKNFAIPRPLPFFNTKREIKKSNSIKIGSFGFGLINKYFNEVCRIVNEQFADDLVEIRLHLTSGTFAGPNQNISYIKELCHSNITQPNISLNITTDFISDEELLDFLFENDLNVFFYQDYSDYNGISSVIDYALAVEKPIAINKSSMYSHIIDVHPSICVEDRSLSSIIKDGFSPLKNKKDSWSSENFIYTFENILENFRN
jgi:hypothetical protein